MVKSNNSKTKPVKYPFTTLMFIVMVIYGVVCVFSETISIDYRIIIFLIIAIILDLGLKNGK